MASKEGVGGFLKGDRGGNGGYVLRAQFPSNLDTFFYIGIFRFAGKCKVEVGCGVLVSAIDQGVVWQAGKTLQGVVQLRSRAFEIPAATGTEQDVATEYDTGCKKGDMVFKMTWYFDDIEGDILTEAL